MSWVRFDDKRSVNGKLRKAGFAARGLDEAAICWSAHQEDDGFISTEDVEMLAMTHGCRKVDPLVQALVEVERWEPMVVEGSTVGYLLKNFLEYNPSKAELEVTRKQKQEAGRKGGLASKGGVGA